ncbi:unnamed protein product, partial [Callosobruchus maculatus]
MRTPRCAHIKYSWNLYNPHTTVIHKLLSI